MHPKKYLDPVIKVWIPALGCTRPGMTQEKNMTFRQQVIEFIQKIPKGKVVSYGQVAAFAGNPRAARQVGMILRNLDIRDIKVPWWRIINNQGIISIKGNWTATKENQKQLLIKDGIKFEREFKINMEKYRYSY